MENNSYPACKTSVSSKVAESNRESAYIVNPVQYSQAHLAEVLDLTDTATSKASSDARLDSLKGYQSQNSQSSKEVVVEDPWANAEDGLLSFLAPPPSEADTRGAISDTPDLSMNGSSGDSISQSVESDTILDISNDKSLPLGLASVNELYDTASVDDMAGFDKLFDMNNDPIETFQAVFKFPTWEWDDIFDQSVLVDQKPTSPSGTSSPVDVNKMAATNQIFVRHLLPNRLSSEK